jgi:hypothetical protein
MWGPLVISWFRARFFARGKAPKSTILCTKENTQNNVRPKYKEILFLTVTAIRTDSKYHQHNRWAIRKQPTKNYQQTKQNKPNQTKPQPQPQQQQNNRTTEQQNNNNNNDNNNNDHDDDHDDDDGGGGDGDNTNNVCMLIVNLIQHRFTTMFHGSCLFFTFSCPGNQQGFLGAGANLSSGIHTDFLRGS